MKTNNCNLESFFCHSETSMNLYIFVSFDNGYISIFCGISTFSPLKSNNLTLTPISVNICINSAVSLLPIFFIKQHVKTIRPFRILHVDCRYKFWSGPDINENAKSCDKMLFVIMTFVERFFVFSLGGDPAVVDTCGEGPVIISVTNDKSTKKNNWRNFLLEKLSLYKNTYTKLNKLTSFRKIFNAISNYGFLQKVTIM